MNAATTNEQNKPVLMWRDGEDHVQEQELRFAWIGRRWQTWDCGCDSGDASDYVQSSIQVK